MMGRSRLTVAVLALSLSLMAITPILARAQTGEDDNSLRVGVFPHKVQISTNYHGAHLFLFGVTPTDTDIVLRVEGPSPAVKLSRYGHVMGLLWMPIEQIEATGLPGFYGVISSQPLEDILTVEDQRRLLLDPKRNGLRKRISMRYAETQTEITGDRFETYVNDVFDLGRGEDHFLWDERGVVVAGPDFEAVLNLPPDAMTGDYTVHVFAIRDKKVVASNSTLLRVEKSGLIDMLATQAVDRPSLTGLLAVLLPAIAGLGVARLFGMRGGH